MIRELRKKFWGEDLIKAAIFSVATLICLGLTLGCNMMALHMVFGIATIILAIVAATCIYFTIDGMIYARRISEAEKLTISLN